MPTFQNSIARSLNDKLGESISVLDFGAVADGATDCASAFASAVAAANSVGGCSVYIPRGNYILNSSVLVSSAMSNITFEGDGAATLVKRGAALPSGKGLFDVSGVNIQFRRMAVDGAVTTSTGLQYGTFTDPMDARLSGNTSFWIHGGAKKIRFTDVTVQHTGGYSILLDATTGDISDVRILDCTFENNRPHLNGPAGDLNYGSWTGGVHFQGDGANYAVKNLVVRHCTFRRNTGNCVWGHAYAFGKLHSNFTASGNYFEDCGLDGVLVAAVSGGVVEGNRFRRMGYICSIDTSASVPKFLSTAYACAIDTAGLARGVNYVNNTFMSINGGCMDLDGFCQGTVSGNTCIIPSPGEPEYAEDSIATFGNGNTGSNWVYGVQPSNTNNISLPGTDITVTGNTFINMGGGAVRMFAARNCIVQGNNIIHPAGANYPAISLGNTGMGPYQQANGNVVTGNQISWSPSAIQPAIFEDATYGAFTSSDKNWVSGNRFQGNCFEFQKDPNSASSTAVVVSSAANGLLVRSENIVQREGVGNSAVYRTYQNTEAGAPAFSSLFDVLTSNGVTVVGGPLFNISNDGAAGTGSFSTGARTASAFDDALLTGKIYGDGFLALTDTTYLAAQVDALPATVGLIRYDSTNRKFVQSLSVSGGHRVWTDLGGGSSSIPSWVTMTDSGVARNLQLAGGASAPGIFTLLASNGTDYADWTYNGSDADFDVSAGGINLRPLSASGAVRVWNPTSSVKLRVGSGGFSAALDLWHDGANAGISPTTGYLYLYGNTLVDVAGNLSAVGAVSATGGFNTTNTAFNAIQAASGGVNAKFLTANVSLSMVGTTASIAGLSSGGQGRIYFDSGAGKFYVSENGGAYVALVASGGSVTAVNGFGGAVTLAGTANQVNVSGASGTVTFSLPQSIATASSVTFYSLLASDAIQSNRATGPAIYAPNAYIQGKGFVSSGLTGYNSIQSDSGISAGTGSQGGYYVGSTQVINTAGAWVGSGVVSKVNGIGGAVTLAAGANITITPGGSTLTIAAAASGYGYGADAYFNSATVPNAGFYCAKDTGGTARGILSIHADNNLYLDNVSLQDIYIRPASGRYVFLGYGAGGAGEIVAPNGNGTASLGNGSYRWNTLYVQSINFSSSGGYSGGTGISVSGATITNTGVTAVYSGTGISVNANTGGLTVTNSGVTAVYAGTGISVNSNTGGLTITNTAPGVSYSPGTGVTISSGQISIGQWVGTGNSVSFYSVSTSAGMQINQNGGYGLYLPSSYVYANGINSFSGSWNGIQSSGGVSANSGFYMSGGTQVINSSGQFCGNGVTCPSYGVQAAGFNPTGWTGQSYVLYFPSGFQISGYTYYNARFVGGVFVQAY